MKSEIGQKSDFSIIRYSQCWEDAEILLNALEVKEGETCLSIGSAGENSIALLLKNPKKVIAIDLSPAQIALIELKKEAFRLLGYEEMLEFLGIKESNSRIAVYIGLRENITEINRKYWDNNLQIIKNGVIHSGKFERFLKIFREKILPLVHNKREIEELLRYKANLEERELFYNRKWNNLRWKFMIKLFFSKNIVGKYGRDRRFFDYAEKRLSKLIEIRCRHALAEMDVSKNSFIEYILKGEYKNNFPLIYREENFEIIKRDINKLEIKCISIEEFLDNTDESIDKFNLSNIFEYISAENFHKIIEKILNKGENNGRMAYWNLLVDRESSKIYEEEIEKNGELSKELYREDKAFFYSNFIVETIRE